MRDIDAQFATLIVTRRGETFGEVTELAGKRLALGSRDSGHAAILPLHYLAEQGLDAGSECDLVRFDTDLGKHGDTGDSELRVIQAVADGSADAGALGEPTLAAFRADGCPPWPTSRWLGAARPITTATSPRFPRWTTGSRSAGRRR